MKKKNGRSYICQQRMSTEKSINKCRYKTSMFCFTRKLKSKKKKKNSGFGEF